MSASEAQFASQIEGYINKVQAYEDELAQAMALSLLDLEALRIRAQEASMLTSLFADDDQSVLSEQDALALELLSWFKLDFFKWVDKLPCDYCGDANTTFSGNAKPSADDQSYGASRVEAYFCAYCGFITRFPRYNDPIKLLETRRGRCGEWANCFALFCRAAGLQTRLVADWSDHIWCEYYSDAQKRWIHIDPCEGIADKPLLYEKGWGKTTLNYVIAVDKNGIADVTRRYTQKQNDEILKKRTLVREEWLKVYIRGTNQRLRKALVGELQRGLEIRDAQEEAELNSVLHGGEEEEELPGRQTGSAEWVGARGEGGTTTATDGLTASEHKKKKKATYTRYRWARDTVSADCVSSSKTDRRVIGGVIRASGENPPAETVERLCDGSISTKWLDFSGSKPDTTWIEYRLLPTDELISIVGYCLVSANDSPERDPRCVVLEAWDENTNSWIVLDERGDIQFSHRGEKLDFVLEQEGNDVKSRRWRMRIKSVRDMQSANSVQLSGWMLYYR